MIALFLLSTLSVKMDSLIDVGPINYPCVAKISSYPIWADSVGITISEVKASTNSEGYFGIELYRNVSYKLEISLHGYGKIKTIPDQESINYKNLP